MKNIFMLIKINLLALLAIPILGITIIAKLVQKAIEQLGVFIGLAGTLIVISLVHLVLETGGIINGLAMVIGMLLLFGGGIAIITLVFTCFGSMVAALVRGLTVCLLVIVSIVFDLSHHLYSKIYDVCKKDFESLKDSDTSSNMRFGCIFWYLLMAVNKIIVMIFSNAFLISIVCTVISIGYLIRYVHNCTFETFGIGVIKYLGLFPTRDVVFTILYCGVIVIAAVIIIITLGAECNEWGNTLKYATQDYAQYKALMDERTMKLETSATADYTFEEGKNIQRCEEYMNVFRELGENAPFLYDQANVARNLKEDSALSHDLIEYIDALEAISKEIEKYDGKIPSDYFERKLIPMIEMAKMQSKSIEKKVFKILNSEVSKPHKNDGENDLFGGCSNLGEVKKRYRSLCKVYHPDEGGHEGMFNQIQNQYEQKLVEFKGAE